MINATSSFGPPDSALVAQVLSNLAGVLTEYLNFALGVFEKAGRLPDSHEDDVPSLLLFLRCIELADAVAILVTSWAVEPAKIQLRALCEAAMQLRFMLTPAEKSKRKGRAFWTTQLKKRIADLEKEETGTPRHQRILDLLATDAWVPGYAATESSTARDEITELEALLSRGTLEELSREFDRLKAGVTSVRRCENCEHEVPTKARGLKPEWYALYSGPRNMVELARQCGVEGSYEIFYRAGSQAVHANDVANRLSEAPDGRARFHALRNPEQSQGVVSVCVILMQKAIEEMIRRFVPAMEFDFLEFNAQRAERLTSLLRADAYTMVEPEP